MDEKKNKKSNSLDDVLFAAKVDNRKTEDLCVKYCVSPVPYRACFKAVCACPSYLFFLGYQFKFKYREGGYY